MTDQEDKKNDRINRIIDLVIRENWQGELYIHLIVLFFVAGGVTALSIGATNGNTGVVTAGATTGTVLVTLIDRLFAGLTVKKKIRLLQLEIEQEGEQADIKSRINSIFQERKKSFSWSSVIIMVAVSITTTIMILVIAKSLFLI